MDIQNPKKVVDKKAVTTKLTTLQTNLTKMEKQSL